VIPLRDINPTERFAVVTLLLVIANSAVFLYEMTLGSTGGELFLSSYALVPARLFSPAVLNNDGSLPVAATIVTSMFLHGGIPHIAGNMLYLWIFGNNVEDAMGRLRFMLFYVLCGMVAAMTHALANTSSVIPMIGASGAVSGVLGAYALLYPRARVVTLVFFGFYIRTIEIPALFVLGSWFLIQFLSALSTSSSGGGIAWYAHVGGFVAGMALIGLFKRSEVPYGGGRRSHSLWCEAQGR
jgi:membrane associated rhomboid family serine protease